MGGYRDGRRDCEIPACALYHWMPYRAGRKDEPRPERSPAQLAADEKAAARLRSMRCGLGARLETGRETDGEG